MSQFNYDDYEKMGGFTGGKSDSAKGESVRYLVLQNDGDEAVVRFAIKSTQDFKVLTYHTVEVEGKKIKVSCLRNSPTEPLDSCPLCEAEEPISTKLFIKLIRYVKDPDTNNIVIKPCIWQRPYGFGKTLKSLIEEYGDLTDVVFKIKRCGAKGNQDTTYTVIPANPQFYKEELYVKDFSAFDNYNFVGRGGAIKDKTYDQMVSFLETGEFPAPVRSESKEVEDEIPQNNYSEDVCVDAPYDEEAPVEEPVYEAPSEEPQQLRASPAPTAVRPAATVTRPAPAASTPVAQRPIPSTSTMPPRGSTTRVAPTNAGLQVGSTQRPRRYSY